jgi:hypothetical protein
MSSADSCDAEVIALDDTADIDEVVNESESDPVIAVKKRYISEADFEYVREDNSPICGSVMSAHVAFLMEAYTTKYADRRHPEDSKMCMAFVSHFLQLFTSRKRSRSGRAPYSLGRLTLPPMPGTEFEAIDTSNLALVFFPTLVELGGEISAWALLVFCFERKTCFYCCDELTPPHRHEHPAHPAFVAIIQCFQEIWQVDTHAWSLVDIAPRRRQWGIMFMVYSPAELTCFSLRTLCCAPFGAVALANLSPKTATYPWRWAFPLCAPAPLTATSL